MPSIVQVVAPALIAPSTLIVPVATPCALETTGGIIVKVFNLALCFIKKALIGAKSVLLIGG
jgi:hypothetical protein